MESIIILLSMISGAVLFASGFLFGWKLRDKPEIEKALRLPRLVEKAAEAVTRKFEQPAEPLPRTDADEYIIEEEKRTGKKVKLDPRLRDPGVYGTGL